MSKYARGTTASLEVVFKGSDGDPIVPFDSTYPQIVIKDPTGVIQASGVGVQATTPGLWRFEWSIPAGANLDPGWSVDWHLLSLNKEEFNQTFCLELSDQITTEDSLDREGAYLTLCGKNERLFYRSAVQVENITVSLVFGGETAWEATQDQITEVLADGIWNYYVDTPALTTDGTYVVYWDVRETALSRSDQVVQHLRVAAPNALLALPYLRGLLDKLNKVQDTPLSYTDSELYQYLERGLDLLNGVHPFTQWNLNVVPVSLMSWWVLLSGWWGLNSRQLLEVEVSHQFEGQQVNLSYDHASPLGEIISRWETLVWERLPPAKVSLYRRTAGPGVVAVRPYRLSMENRVYRAGTAQSALADFPGLAGLIGLPT